MSINMVASCGSKERTFDEYGDLFVRAGIHNAPKVVHTRNILSLIEVEIE
jgi:hypothetical protein